MKTALVIAVLSGLLAAAVWLAWSTWSMDGADQAPISTAGMVALVLGSLGALALGGGLMFLVFYSHRRGYDEAADQWDRRMRQHWGKRGDRR